MKVLVLAGGSSEEREVSLASGSAVYNALRRLDHEVVALDPATGLSLLDNDGKFLTFTKASKPEDISLDAYKPHALISSLSQNGLDNIDVVFIALHGGSGENGSIQSLLELAGMKYTGSDMTASAVAMNKAMSKQLMKSVGVVTPQWLLCQINNKNALRTEAERIRGHFGCPLIVKPNNSGSTVGLTKVDQSEDIVKALEFAARYSNQILVENFIKGRELTVSVFDSRAYPVVEIKPVSGLYDYEAKYTKGKSEYIAPAHLDDKLAADIKQAAEKVYDVIGASGLARVDFILDDGGAYHCLELNTLPGMTDLSLAPMALKCTGIEFDQLVEMIIESAIKRGE